jgi:NAD(P)-dependent dehydrogenase (short-subunit alcohol dehydrogenase family)
MACRNLDKAEEAKATLLSLYPNAKLFILPYDQADFRSINEFVKVITTSYKDVDGLILNAGIYHPKKGFETKEGFPITIGTNYIGIFYLLRLLFESNTFNDNKERSIVFVGSLSWHKVKKSKIQEVLTKSSLTAIAEYSRSKTLLGALAYQLSRHNKNNQIYFPKHIKILMMHPGITSTNIVASKESSYPKWFSKLAQKVLHLFVHHSDVASLGIIKCALCVDINEDEIVVPRGLFHISGYPTVKGYPNNLKHLDKSSISITEEIINQINLKEV